MNESTIDIHPHCVIMSVDGGEEMKSNKLVILEAELEIMKVKEAERKAEWEKKHGRWRCEFCHLLHSGPIVGKHKPVSKAETI